MTLYRIMIATFVKVIAHTLEVTQESDEGFVAECLSESIFTQADTWDELRKNVQEAVNAFYFDKPQPATIRLHLVRDEVWATV